MLRQKGKRLTWILIALLAGLTLTILGQGIVSALSNGSIAGRSQSGCAVCHGASPSPGVTVTISGPTEVAPGGTYSYTVELQGSPTKGGGLNLSVSAGELSPGNNTQLVRGELTHLDNRSRSWTINWTAPKTLGPVNMFVAANATNNDGMPTGDAWNLTSIAINVAAPPVAGIQQPPAGQQPAPPSAPGPSPTVSKPTSSDATLTLDAPQEWVAGQPLTFRAILTDGQGQPIAGESISFFTQTDFFIEGLASLGQVKTDGQGQALLKYTPRSNGEVLFVAKYSGNNLYKPTQAEFKLKVAPLGPLYQPQAGLSLPFIGPWLLALLIVGIWSIYFFVWYQILRISRE